jgi:LmbE family N-acetylglucosaminyl deacetylase
MNQVKEAVRRFTARGMAAALRRRSVPLPSIDGPLLVIAPHPDDDVLGCGGLVARQALAGRRVRVLYVTSGEKSHRGHPEVTSETLAGLRREEAISGLAALGVVNPRSTATFLGLPDGDLNRLPSEDQTALIDVFVKWIGADRPEVVCAPFLGGGSSEHDAVVQFAIQALGLSGGGILAEYPIWAWWNPLRLRSRLGARAGNFRLSLAGLRARKQSAIACHRSQVEPLPPWTEAVLPRAIVDPCTAPDEFYFYRQVEASR